MDKNRFYDIVSPHSMTSKERINCLYDCLEKIRLDKVAGDLVECGVWRGGNILGMIEYSRHHRMQDIRIWAYDTFSGMTKPQSIDVDHMGNMAEAILDSVMCLAPYDQFCQITNCRQHPNVRIVAGDICETLLDAKNIPNSISLLRLDTDWYASTKVELEVLYPKLSTGGVLIVDDYGHWGGCKQAVTEYFGGNFSKTEIDYTGIMVVKHD